MSTTAEKVKNLIATQLDCEVSQLNDTTHFINDLGADSLDVVEMIMAMEEEFEVEIPDDQAEKIGTVGDVIRFIEENQK